MVSLFYKEILKCPIKIQFPFTKNCLSFKHLFFYMIPFYSQDVCMHVLKVIKIVLLIQIICTVRDVTLAIRGDLL